MLVQISRIALLAFLILMSPFSVRAGDVTWNGFSSVYYGQNLTEEMRAPIFADNRADFANFSNLGLNISSKLTRELSAAAQFVAFAPSSTAPWNVLTNWAYLVYKPVDGTLIKAGRHLMPVYIASEYLSVGYLQPFRRMPVAAYAISPFTGFDGISIKQDIMTIEGLGTLNFSLFGGNPNLSPSPANAGGIAAAPPVPVPPNVVDAVGATIALDGVGYRVQAHVNRAQVIMPLFGAEAAPVTATFGYRYDNHNFVSWGEFAWTESKGSDNIAPNPAFGIPGGRLLENAHGYYVLAGYRFGDFLPRYTYSASDVRTGFVNGTLATHVAGLNYQVNPQAIIKAEFEMDAAPDVTSGRLPVQMVRKAGSKETKANAIFVGVDFIF